MFDFYDKYLKDFGELLTDMERVGIKVDTTGMLFYLIFFMPRDVG